MSKWVSTGLNNHENIDASEREIYKIEREVKLETSNSGGDGTIWLNILILAIIFGGIYFYGSYLAVVASVTIMLLIMALMIGIL